MRRRFALILTVVLALGAGWWVWSDAEHATPGSDAPRLDAAYPSDWAWRQRTFPHFRADPAAYRTALAHAHALRAAAKRSPAGTWQFAGPTNIGGRVSDVAFDPHNPDVVYAGAATGGVFKSTDRGVTWLPIFDDQAVLPIGDLALDPSTPGTVYVGTGEANGGHNNFAGGGVFKSTDGGDTWRFLGLEATVSTGRILVHPTNPSRVYVAAVGSYFGPNPERGVYRSDDGGDTWGKALFVNDSTGAVDLVMRPDDPDVLFAATWERVRRPTTSALWGAGSGIWKSTDGGDTWTRLGPENGLPDPAERTDADGRPRHGRIGLAICRDQPDVMYALYNDGLNILGLYRTDDGGASWRRVDADGGLRSAGFSWYFGQVRVHPEDPDHVFVLDLGLQQSTDGGVTWSFDGGTHVDHHALAFAPDDPDFVIEGNDGGLARSSDGGQTWTRVAHLPITQFYEISVDPHDADRRFGGTQDNGTLRTQTGRADDWANVLSGDGFHVLIDPTDPNVVYAEIQWGGLRKSTNGGLSFASATSGIDRSEPTNWNTPITLDPSDAQRVYYGTNRVWRSPDGAATWQPISPVLTRLTSSGSLGTLTGIAVAPTDGRVIYAGTDDGLLWVSRDDGATWMNITGPAFPLRWITRVVVDPREAAVAYVTFSGLKWKDPVPHVFRTRDFGQTWTDITANLPDAPVNALAIDPDVPGVLYLGSDVGVFVSRDDGGAWEALGDGLPAAPVNDLDVHAASRTLFAGTHGRSMYTLDLAGFAVATDTPPAPTAFALDAPFPNPSADATTLPFTLAGPGTVRLAVFDMLGREVRMLASGAYAAGRHVSVWDGRDASGRLVAAGRYVLRLTGPGGTATQLVTRTR